MTTRTFEGTIENGQIKLRENVSLPENTAVVVTVSEQDAVPTFHVYSPHLVNRADAECFAKEVIEAPFDDRV